jgi:hypothetical protein
VSSFTSERTRLILVEGLSGSGKSILAHALARQLEYNGISADWYHEGPPNPVTVAFEGDTDVGEWMDVAREKWCAFVDKRAGVDGVAILDATLLCNLIESLVASQVDLETILCFAREISALVEPLRPVLVYLHVGDTTAAFQENFANRGEDFREHAIAYVSKTSFGRSTDLTGDAAVYALAIDFVRTVDHVFDCWPLEKLRLNGTSPHQSGNIDEVMAALGLACRPEERDLGEEAVLYQGSYKDDESGREFTIRADKGHLSVNLWFDVNSSLVRTGIARLSPEGFPFDLEFDVGPSGQMETVEVVGRDISYLGLVGTVARRIE